MSLPRVHVEAVAPQGAGYNLRFRQTAPGVSQAKNGFADVIGNHGSGNELEVKYFGGLILL